MYDVPTIVEEMRAKEVRDYNQMNQETLFINQNKINTKLKEVDPLEDIWFHVWRML